MNIQKPEVLHSFPRMKFPERNLSCENIWLITTKDIILHRNFLPHKSMTGALNWW